MDLTIEEWRGSRVDSLPITALSIHPKLGIAMIIRKNGGEKEDIIDQVNMRCEWMGVRERRFSIGAKIEDVEWIGDNAVVCCLDGRIAVMNAHSSSIHFTQIAPCALFSITPLDSSIALLISHTSQLYYVNIDSISVIKSVSIGVDTRLFSLTARGDNVAIGALDGVWIVNGKGYEKKELRLGRNDGDRLGSIVWSVSFINDDTLASGDSTGTISIWNIVKGSLITSVCRHQADILCLTVLEGKIYAAGVDPSILILQQMSNGEWKDTCCKRIVTRDVRVLHSWSDRVYGAGSDNEVFRVFPKPSIIPIGQHKCIDSSGRLTLITNINHVQVWSTSSSPPSFIAQIHSPYNLPICSAAISQDGDVIGISCREGTFLYSLTCGRVEKMLRSLPSSSLIVFNQSYLYMVEDNKVYRVDLRKEDWKRENIFKSDDEFIISHISICPSSKWMSLITSRSQCIRISLNTLTSCTINVPLPIDSCFSSSNSLFILSCHTHSVSLPSLYEVLPNSNNASNSYSSRDIFQFSSISSIRSSPLGVLCSSDESMWSLLTNSSKVFTSPQFINHSCNGMERHIPSVGSYSNTIRVNSSILSSPSVLPFKSKRYGMQ